MIIIPVPLRPRFACAKPSRQDAGRLDGDIVCSLKAAQIAVESWRCHDSTLRPTDPSDTNRRPGGCSSRPCPCGQHRPRPTAPPVLAEKPSLHQTLQPDQSLEAGQPPVHPSPAKWSTPSSKANPPRSWLFCPGVFHLMRMGAPVTQSEKTALALLRSGFSWQEASNMTHVRFERLRELWAASSSAQKESKKQG